MIYRFPEFAHRMPWFPIFYLYSTWSGQVTVYAFAGTDGFFFGVTLYMAFLLQALRYDVQDALKPVQGGCITQRNKLIRYDDHFDEI